MQSPKREFYQIVFGNCLLIYFDRSDLIDHEGYAIIRCLWQGNLAVYLVAIESTDCAFSTKALG